MIALVVVLAAALADTATPSVGLSWLTPGFITALTTLIVAITGLAALFRKADATKVAVDDTQEKVGKVAAQTNGVVAAMQERLTFLEQELAGTAHRGATRLATGPTGPTSAPPA